MTRTLTRRLLDGLYRLSGGFAALFILAIVVLVMGQVVLNSVDRIATLFTGSAIGLTIPSYADFTGFFLAAASFLALAYTLREGAHIRVTLITGRLPATLDRFVEMFAVAAALATTLFITWYTISLTLESYEYDDMSAGMVAVPLWIPQSSMCVGSLVLAIALTDDLVALLRGRQASWHGKGEELLAAAMDTDTNASTGS